MRRSLRRGGGRFNDSTSTPRASSSTEGPRAGRALRSGVLHEGRAGQGDAQFVPRVRSAECQDGGCRQPAEWRAQRVAAGGREASRVPAAARDVVRGRGDCAGTGCAAVLAQQLRARRPRGRAARRRPRRRRTTLIDGFVLPAEARTVSLSLDRVAVPMEEARPRPVGRPRAGAPKNPVDRFWHMAFVATLTLHDRAGAALHTSGTAACPNWAHRKCSTACVPT